MVRARLELEHVRLTPCELHDDVVGLHVHIPNPGDGLNRRRRPRWLRQLPFAGAAARPFGAAGRPLGAAAATAAPTSATAVALVAATSAVAAAAAVSAASAAATAAAASTTIIAIARLTHVLVIFEAILAILWWERLVDDMTRPRTRARKVAVVYVCWCVAHVHELVRWRVRNA